MKERKAVGYKNYIIGFGLSIILTLAAYVIAQHHLGTKHIFPSDRVMPVVLLSLAVIQLVVQLVFFLHLAKEDRPRWRGLAAIFALLMVLILVVGSLWIMDNLNYRMTPTQINNYLKNQDGGI